jgi:hypothetical protein
VLLEGKAVAGGAVVGLTGVIAAFTALPSMAQDVILAAAAITALKVVWGVGVGDAAVGARGARRDDGGSA